MLIHVTYQSNLCVFFLAGHDTTASALAYAIYYLAVNPSAQDKARKEALAVLGNDPIPSLDQMRSLSFINMVIKEVKIKTIRGGSFFSNHNGSRRFA